MIDLLLMRAFLLNVAGGALLAVGLESHVIQDILLMDQTYISEAIIVAFGIGWLYCMFRVWECSNILNKVERLGTPFNHDDFEAWTGQRRNVVDVVARLLFRGGLFGTVYGFVMALGGLHVESLTSAATAGAQIGIVISNMQVALVTTLTGVATNIYLVLNQRLLEGGYERLKQEM